MKVTDKCAQNSNRLNFICDFSPTRGVDPSVLERARKLEADYICVAYNPGKAVRVDTVAMAYQLKQQSKRDVIFNLACRDMNKLAIQSHLLGASMLGLENVVVVRGDAFKPEELEKVKEVSDYKTTELIEAIKQLNGGIDYRGSTLKFPTDLCVGSTLDLAHGAEREAALVQTKIQKGVDFLLTQSVFDISTMTRFLDTYNSIAKEKLNVPVFCGLQILEKDTVIFGNPPPGTMAQLDHGRSGVDIALELLHSLIAAGFRNIYLVPPILKGGARNYEAAQALIEASRSMAGKAKSHR